MIHLLGVIVHELSVVLAKSDPPNFFLLIGRRYKIELSSRLGMGKFVRKLFCKYFNLNISSN